MKLKTNNSEASKIFNDLSVINPPSTPTSVVNKQYVDSLLGVNNAPGNILFTASNTFTPAGYLRCNGASVSVQTFSALFSSIGHTFTNTPTIGNGQPFKNQFEINYILQEDLDIWFRASVLPGAISESTAVVTNSRIYMFGRRSTTTAITANVYTAPILLNGTVGAWVTVTSLPVALVHSKAITIRNFIYLLGGSNGTSAVNTVLRTTINSDGTIGTWSTYASLPVTLHSTEAVVVGNRVYLIGGVTGVAATNRVYTATIDANGNIGVWSLALNLPYTVTNHSTTVIRNRIYVFGGVVNGVHSGRVIFGRLSSSGIIESWEDSVSIPETITSSCLVCSKHRVYLITGFIDIGSSSRVYSVGINADGSLNSWRISGNLPDTTTHAQAVVTSIGIFALGGVINGVISSRVNAIFTSGGLNDYSAFYSSIVNTDPNMFNLPDYTHLEVDGIYSFIRV